jgi:mRNA interferase RelE/StbE
MIVKIDKSFEKDTDKIKDKKILFKIAECIERIQNSDDILSIKNIKKLKGSNKYYRIRLGDYRIGIIIENDIVEFVRFLHRKDVYKYFPNNIPRS